MNRPVSNSAQSSSNRASLPRTAAGGVRVVGQRVEDEVGEAVPCEVPGGIAVRGEYQPLRRDAAALRLATQVARRHGRGLDEPQHAARHPHQQAHPDGEHLRRNLVAVVEAAEHEAVLGQPFLGTRGHVRVDRPAVVVGLVAVGQAHDALRVVALVLLQDDVPVGDEVVDVGRPQRAREAEVVDLNGRGTPREHALAAEAVVAVQVDQHVDLPCAHRRGGGRVVQRGDRHDCVEGGDDAPAQFAAVVVAVVEGDELEALPVVCLPDAGHQQRRGVSAELAAQVADADPAVAIAHVVAQRFAVRRIAGGRVG